MVWWEMYYKTAECWCLCAFVLRFDSFVSSWFHFMQSLVSWLHHMSIIFFQLIFCGLSIIFMKFISLFTTSDVSYMFPAHLLCVIQYQQCWNALLTGFCLCMFGNLASLVEFLNIFMGAMLRRHCLWANRVFPLCLN